MKISLNWVKQFTDVDISVDELVEKIGAQLGAVEGVVNLGKKYQGIIIAKVVSSDKHPNADKLSVCWIDDGSKAEGVERNEQGLIQVVCGAPNVRAGLLVAWLPPGSTVPSSYDKDPFVLSARDLRGVTSNGMLASSKELAIGDDHNGIVELELDVAPGTDFAEAYQLNDYIIDIENKMFTHRPDCFGILGVAREIAGIRHAQFTSPDWYTQALDRIKPGHTKLPLTVTNNLPELVPRFMAVAMADVTVKPSPLMLQTYLSRVGLRPVNNIVDITNYLMYLTGQPTHAYDANKLQGYGQLSLETRMSHKGDKINLLNGKTVELTDDTTMLITSNDVPVGIAGVMGGTDTEVDDTTKNIVLECANFNMYAVRRAGMKYGLFTDALTRFNKGQSPLQNDVVLEELVVMIQSMAGAHVASAIIDQKSETVQPWPSVQVTPQFINERLGVDLSLDEIAGLLRNVEFKTQHDGDLLDITPPYWRTDIEISEDIVEEVGRLYGYDQLPLTLPGRDLTPAQVNTELAVKREIRRRLSQSGANEVLTYAFVHGNLLQKTGQDSKLAFKLSNAISPDLQYYRLSLTPSLLEKVHPNIKAGTSEFALFEIGKTHGTSDMDENGLPKEFERIALVLARDAKASAAAGAPYFAAKRYVEWLYGDKELRFVPFSEVDLGDHKMFAQLRAPFEPGRSAVVYFGDLLAGVVGEYTSAVRRNLKLPAYTAGFELFLSTLLEGLHDKPYQPVPRFPKVEQDITLRVPDSVSYQALKACLEDSLKAPLDTVWSLQPLDIFKRSDKDEHKQVSFRLTIASHDRTLTSEEINTMLDSAAARTAEVLQAERV